MPQTSSSSPAHISTKPDKLREHQERFHGLLSRFPALPRLFLLIVSYAVVFSVAAAALAIFSFGSLVLSGKDALWGGGMTALTRTAALGQRLGNLLPSLISSKPSPSSSSSKGQPSKAEERRDGR
ncbi:MAG: hypothetical protein DHS80DRAFT_25711 [Piptocephalis tieghemiana]|nr:MAG: hypothetical protein DHS80DRAFT_25711 [Piptocephalis tieghemiana]